MILALSIHAVVGYLIVAVVVFFRAVAQDERKRKTDQHDAMPLPVLVAAGLFWPVGLVRAMRLGLPELEPAIRRMASRERPPGMDRWAHSELRHRRAAVVFFALAWLFGILLIVGASSGRDLNYDPPWQFVVGLFGAFVCLIVGAIATAIGHDS